VFTKRVFLLQKRTLPRNTGETGEIGDINSVKPFFEQGKHHLSGKVNRFLTDYPFDNDITAHSHLDAPSPTSKHFERWF
jgi:hypothetical protein